jgi:Resolvase, N terminal domain
MPDRRHICRRLPAPALSAKSLQRPGIERLLALVDGKKVQAVIVAKLDRLTRSVKDLCELLERFERRGVALISAAESLDTSSAAGRLVLNIMTAVSQWEREAIGERTRDAMNHKRSQGERVGNVAYGFRLAEDGQHLESDPDERAALAAHRIVWIVDRKCGATGSRVEAVGSVRSADAVDVFPGTLSSAWQLPQPCSDRRLHFLSLRCTPTPLLG